jgi:RNA-directed DNA polymerase
MRGWSNYFNYAAANHTMSSPENFMWHRVIRTAGDGTMSADNHSGRNGRWVRPSADGVELFKLAKVPITRYRCRGAQIPNPWILANPA